MDVRSESFFPKVELDLVRVIRFAAQEPQPFVVVQGIRSPAMESVCVAHGTSTTMHSRHLPDKNGLAAAVDVAALIDGKVSFAPGREAEVFGAIVTQIKTAAANLGIEIECGIDWATFKDYGHIQLLWAICP